ncbi:MAG: NDP-sugar synthase [Cyanobacteria bacterium TGS_CYA1]|nr:NDP-sugar synthase [Cyanobacteria bacterium TGS_CYA1]
MKAMVLAAGVGSRLEPLTSSVPKPLVPIANTPVMEHIVKLLAKHGIKDIIANLHYLPEQIKAYFKDGHDLGINIRFIQEDELTGDAGGVRACKDFLGDETFIVLMGDLVTDADLTKIVKEHKAKKAIATIALKKVPDVQHFGVAVQDGEGYITGFQEKPALKDALSDMASAGIYVLEPEVFKHIPEDGVYGFGRQLFPSLIEKGLPVFGSTIETYWSDVGTHEQYKQSNFDVLNGLVKTAQPLDQKAKRIEKDGSVIWIEPGAELSESVEIKSGSRILIGAGSDVSAGAKLAGVVVLGSRCHVEKGACIENAVLWSDCIVKADEVVKDCILGKDCVAEVCSKPREVAAVAGGSPRATRTLAK